MMSPPQARALRQSHASETITEATTKVFGASSNSLRTKGLHGNDARKVALYLTCRKTTLGLQAIGAPTVGGIARAISSAAKDRRTLRRNISKINKLLEAPNPRKTE